MFSREHNRKNSPARNENSLARNNYPRARSVTHWENKNMRKRPNMGFKLPSVAQNLSLLLDC